MALQMPGQAWAGRHGQPIDQRLCYVRSRRCRWPLEQSPRACAGCGGGLQKAAAPTGGGRRQLTMTARMRHSMFP